MLHFTRSALNTQTAPPNQIPIGLALILTFFIMEPTITRINEEAIQPLRRARSIRMRLWKRHGTLTGIYVSTDSGEGCGTVHGYRRTGVGRNPGGYSEFRAGSQLYDQRTANCVLDRLYDLYSFIVIDMVVASTLMSMGMMMLPPTTISMPFKILLFVLADGWALDHRATGTDILLDS